MTKLKTEAAKQVQIITKSSGGYQHIASGYNNFFLPYSCELIFLSYFEEIINGGAFH